MGNWEPSQTCVRWHFTGISCSQSPHQLKDMNILRHFASLYINPSQLLPSQSIFTTLSQLCNQLRSISTMNISTADIKLTDSIKLFCSPGTETASATLIRDLMSIWKKKIDSWLLHSLSLGGNQCMSISEMVKVFKLGQNPEGGLEERQRSRTELDQSCSYYMAFASFSSCMLVCVTAFAAETITY